MNDVCWFQWGKGEIGLLQLYENYQGSNPSGFSILPVTQILSLGIQIPLVNAVWIVAVLGISMDTPSLKRRPDCVLGVNTLDMNETTKNQIRINSLVAPTHNIR